MPERGPVPVRPERPAVVVPLSFDVHSPSGKTGRMCTGRPVARQHRVPARPPSSGKTGPVRRSCVSGQDPAPADQSGSLEQFLRENVFQPDVTACGDLPYPTPEVGTAGELGDRPCGPVGGPKDSGDGTCTQASRAGPAVVTPVGLAAGARSVADPPTRGNACRRKRGGVAEHIFKTPRPQGRPYPLTRHGPRARSLPRPAALRRRTAAVTVCPAPTGANMQYRTKKGRDWKNRLKSLLDDNNEQHATRNKVGVSHTPLSDALVAAQVPRRNPARRHGQRHSGAPVRCKRAFCHRPYVSRATRGWPLTTD
jgi:hypothetical protein